MEVKISKGSWLNLVDLVEYKGVPFWEMVEFPEIPFSPDDKYVTLDHLTSKRIDLVSYDNYGDSNLWWVLLLANEIEYPHQLISGMKIRVPSKDTIDNLLVKKG